MNKICIYTAVFGGYTPLLQPKAIRQDIDLICFSDDRSIARGVWDAVYCPPVFKHSRLDAKWYRMNSDLVLPQYETTIWVDASFQLGDVGAFAGLCVNAMGRKATALFRHPERDDVYAEAVASTQYWAKKYEGQPLLNQVNHYQVLGLPAEHTLWAGGIQIRDNRSAWVKELNRLWMNECVRWSYQDQLSLPYVLWRLGKTPAVIPGSVYEGANHRWTKGSDR